MAGTHQAESGESAVLDVVRDRVAALEGDLQTTHDEDGLRYMLTLPLPLPALQPSGEAVAATAVMQGVGRE